MIILTDKKLVIPVGIAPNYSGAGNSDIKLQSKSVTITENGSKTLFPDDNYSGFSQVNITTNVANNPVLEDKSVEINENGDYSFIPGPAYDGIGNFRLKVNVASYEPITVESVKTAYPSFENDVTVTPSEGYEAMSSVIVKKAEVNLQDKNVDKASTSEIVLRADASYQGLGTVTVAPIKTKTVSADPSTNVQDFSANTENNEYITNVTVNPVNARSINVDPSTNYQEFSANTENNEYITYVTVNRVGTKTVTLDPSTNSQNVNANVERNEYITSVTVNPVGTKTVTVDPSTNSQVVNANTEGNEYISTVTVNPVGTKTVTVDSSINAQTINANVEGNEYITSVTVNPVKTKSLSITPRIVEQTFTAEQQLYKSVTVNPVTSSIDPNIVPENIAKGVSILGVTGEANTDNFNYLVNTYGAALTVKMKVDKIYTEANDNLISDSAADNYQTSNEGDSGFIHFFGYSGLVNYGSLADRGIVAYAINGELHKAPDTNTAFIPYTKKSNGYDDVVVDVYVDFKQSGRWCAEKENEDYETSPYYGGSEVEYCYLPPIVDFRNYRFIKTTEIIVRNSVNALGPYAINNQWYGNYGNLIFEPCVDGLKRISTAFRLGNNFINKIYIYGNLEDFAGMFGDYTINDSFSHEIYGNTENYPDCLTNVDLINANFHGSITTKDNTPLRLYKKTNNSIDFYEDCITNNYLVSDKYRVIIPESCTELNLNLPNGNLIVNGEYVIDRYIYNKENEEIVFFSTTPPRLPKYENKDQQKLSTSDPNSAVPNNSNLKRVFIPAGSNYDSILREPPFRPEVIEFTPVTDLSTINRAGYYGYTAPDGSHTLLNVATTSQAESDIETIATEINNL